MRYIYLFLVSVTASLLLSACQPHVAVPAPTTKKTPTIPNAQNSITAVHPSAWPQAFKRFYDLAMQGDPIAQNNLGRMYSDGRGVPVDSQQALYWFTQSAQQHHVDALLNLGACYLFGRGVNVNVEQACQYFNQAKELGSREGSDFYQRYC